ncbi:hypothetical protein G7Y29_01560 [Corynebacterium qintianiae]|uniref:Asp23/Gls24 family envelope stress response protein n=1 Tax=Corynebacterium qintianiae TaxID=2709392 RepID=A0A7T0KMR8_9CORY|nr:hypothetical protein [Corynebacterium qintianiae]QPK83525.1 hypothetical protein G7Y29_01560 [Corynebacterium qintianiae]
MPGSITRESGEAIRLAVLSVPGVAGLSAGRFGEVALLLPGTRIHGLRAVDRSSAVGTEIHVVYNVDSGRPINKVAEDVRSAAAAAAPQLDFIDIIVADAQKGTHP